MPRDFFVRTSGPSEITHKNFLPKLLAELAGEFGAVLYQEPEYGYVGYLEFPNGRRFFFRGTSFDLNPQGASAVAEDKDYCARLLSHFGYRVPEGVLLFAPRYRQQMRRRNEAI